MKEKRAVRKTFPVNAMLEGRRALVVGGGRVGQRKVELLLDAGAAVELVCPECVEELAALAREGRVRHVARRFEAGDVQGCALVFACTDDKHVNRAVLAAAQAEGVPCCCADGNWAEGDFVTPAVIRAGDVLIAVSTSGRSCRQARLIKDNLRKHLDSIESSDLLVLGTGHELLSADERAPYHLLEEERLAVGEMIRQVWGVHEFFILNTCNRVELVAAISKEAGTSGILRRLLRFDGLGAGRFYMKRGFEAFAHICQVAAGMGSQTPGEFHVVSQLKAAVDEAVARGWAGSIVRELCDAALHVSKDIRQEVVPLLDVAEIEEVALRYLEAEAPGLAGRTAAVVGSGAVGRGIVEGLARRGCRCLWGYHRNAPELGAGLAGRVELFQLGKLGEALPEAEVVVSAVNVQAPLVTESLHGTCLRGKDVLMVDLGMPRNIDPALGRMGLARVADLDVLKGWYRASNGTLEKVLEVCDGILREHRGIYEKMRRSIRGGGGEVA